MKYKFYFILIFIIFLSALIIFKPQIIEKNTNQKINNCYLNETIIVNGNSMSPLILSNQELNHLKGYYNCNNIKKGDIITYKYSGNNNLLIKQIRAIPNDTFEYKNNKIYINNRSLKNSQNKEYMIVSKILELYANNYPIIPKNTYLILGNNIHGSLDSSKFGLVSKLDIVGKVIISN